MTSHPDLPFGALSDAELYARIDLTAAQQRQLDGKRGPAVKRLQSLLAGISAQLKERLIERGLPPSVPDADYIAARVAGFDRDFPIPKIDAHHSTIRDVSSGDCTVTEPVVGVCSVGDVGTNTAARLPRA